MYKPIIGISMGDPFGNGPEITVRALSRPEVYECCRPVVVGDLTSMEYACRIAAQVYGSTPSLHVIREVSEALFTCGTIDVPQGLFFCRFFNCEQRSAFILFHDLGIGFLGSLTHFRTFRPQLFS